MRNPIIIFILLFFSFYMIYSCSKRHENDPFTVQFKSLKKRIIGEWHMKKIMIDDEDFSYLIEMENDTFFSIYTIFEFNGAEQKGKMEVKTKNEKFLIDRFVYPSIVIYYNSKRKNSEILFTRFSPIPSYGPINDFYYANNIRPPTWEILRLSRKEMLLRTLFNNQIYEISFEKK